MRYAWARYRESRHNLAYRIYISDCLRILTENTAKQLALTPQPQDADVKGLFVPTRFFEPQRQEQTEDVSDGDKIVEDVLRLLGVT